MKDSDIEYDQYLDKRTKAKQRYRFHHLPLVLL